MNAGKHEVDPERSRRLHSIACAAGVVLAVLAVYWPAYRAGFIWDDDAHVTRPELRSLHGLWRIWFDLGATQQYYPVLHSAFWVEHRLWGDSPMGYHLLNVLLHAAAACLFALVLRRLWSAGVSSIAPWLAALVFALHPVCVESVAWVSEQKNTLSAVFYLSAALVYLRWRGSRASTPYLLATGLFVLALLTKSVTATLPAALLVVVWWQNGRLSWRRDAFPLAPWLALGGAAGLFTAWVERRYIGAQGAAFDLSGVERCLLAGRAIGFYLGKLLWPSNLIFIYPRWSIDARVAGLWLYPAGVAIALGLLWRIARGGTRGPLAAFLLFVGSLFPALGFVNVYPFVFSYVADHFQYLASLAIVALAAAGWETWRGRAGLWGRTASWPVAAAAILLLGVLSWRQCRVYRDQRTLYSVTLEKNPGCWLAHLNLGGILLENGDVDEAIAHYRDALRGNPSYADTHFNLGKALLQTGRQSEAEAQFEETVRLDPTDAEAHDNLGIALAGMGRMEEAVAQFETALRLRPDNPRARYNLGIALRTLGRAAGENPP